MLRLNQKKHTFHLNHVHRICPSAEWGLEGADEDDDDNEEDGV